MVNKDNIDVAGLPAASGIAALKARMPQHDAACIARLRAHGAVLLGKTLMDEAALGALGDNAAFGRCHNPLAHGYTPGGSSSGSAAAVAAGLCAAALGTDTLGAVRIPASYCGIVGYVPSRGLVDATGVMPLAASLDRVGVLARSVADAAIVAAALSDSIRRAPPPAASVGLLRGMDELVPTEILAAVESVARALARKGHRIVEVASGAFDWTGVRRLPIPMRRTLRTRKVMPRLISSIANTAKTKWRPCSRNQFKKGGNYDDIFKKVIGVDTDALDNAWRQDVGLKPRAVTTRSLPQSAAIPTVGLSTDFSTPVPGAPATATPPRVAQNATPVQPSSSASSSSSSSGTTIQLCNASFVVIALGFLGMFWSRRRRGVGQ